MARTANVASKTADRLVMALAVVTGVASMGLFAWDGRQRAAR